MFYVPEQSFTEIHEESAVSSWKTKDSDIFCSVQVQGVKSGGRWAKTPQCARLCEKICLNEEFLKGLVKKLV